MKASNMEEPQDKQYVIIGGGPAGLTAAYELTKLNVHPVVLEKNNMVGGISRTESFKGFYFDMGGHRFFTKVPEVNRMWQEVLGPDFITRPRLSRIYYNHKFFMYPVKPFNALSGLGIVQAISVVLSYLRWQLFPFRIEDTFEQWVTNRFGYRLFSIFFKSYTEKVWGIPTSELKAEWAAQRIKDLDLKTTIISMFVKPRKTIKTLIEQFEYPRRGPGMMWKAVQDKVQECGGTVSLNTEVVQINRRGQVIESVVTRSGESEKVIAGDAFISSMPVSEFVKKLNPPAPAPVLEAANKLHYRDFLTVCLIVNKPNLFPDNWIYVHDPDVKVGRIQNFKNWSPDMVPDPDKSSLGMEYFCNEGDETWTMPDKDLVELAKREIDRIGLARYEDIEDGAVFRVEKSYPVYDSDYVNFLGIIKEYLATFNNFQTVGRNGLHRYNNQDHSMLTAMLAVRNLVFGEKNDLWSVNTEQEYHEEIRAAEPEKAHDVAGVIQEALTQVFEKLDPVSFALSTGIMLAGLLSFVTLVLVLRGGDDIGPNLSLLNQFLPGYTVTVEGTLLSLVYGFVIGIMVGGGFAYLRNMVLFLYVAIMDRRVQMSLLREVLDF